jgi:hypothetical protein
MAFTIGAVAAKDGGGNSIGGGLLAADIAGGGVGPWFLFNGLVDGIAGSNKLQINASNQALVLASVASGGIAAGAIAAGATSIADNEDVASADGDRGVKVLAVRKGTPANTSGTDGDYEFLQMSAGRIWASATIDAALPAGTNAIGKLAANSGVDIGDVDVTSIIPGTGATNLGKAIDTATGATDTGVLMLVTRDDALATLTPADGDNVQLRATSTGALWTASADANANGQATMANSSPIVIASDQTPVATVGKTVVKTITMTADTAIMAAADIIADTQQLDGAFRSTDGTGVLQSMTVFDPDDNAAFAFDVYIHKTSTSMGSENSGITITDANASAGIVGVVAFATTDAKDLINGRMYHKTGIGLPIVAVSGTDDLYVSVVNGSGTPTFGGGSLPIQLGILQD